MLKGKEIVLGVSGGIAAYKAAELTRLLVKEGANVNVVMTRNAQEFVTPLTFQTLSGNPVSAELFDLSRRSEVQHVSLAEKSELLIIAPATANIIGKIASGIADDLLTTTVMATRAPIIIAPAMNVQMWENPILQENIKRLKKIGLKIMEPGSGYLACGYEGKGRLAEPEAILKRIKTLLK
jgi:phosphopantothenoylcysteine decarboxylase/phosphopantothenate--cysteine ligase